MAIDHQLESRIRSDLHTALDSVSGPHPAWTTSPAARAIRSGGDAMATPRRRSRPPMLLIAAAIALTAAAGAILAGGGLRQATPQRPAIPAVVVASAAPTPRISASPNVAVATTSPTATPPACATSWSSKGTKDPKGLVDGIRTVEFDGYSGDLVIVFGHRLDTVRKIGLEPVRPPFINSEGRTIKIAGGTFLALSIDGLTRRTQNTPDDMIAGQTVRKGTPTVAYPIEEMRRIVTPRYSAPIRGPQDHATEVWIIGFASPVCLNVRTIRDTGYYPEEPGDNGIFVTFAQRP